MIRPGAAAMTAILALTAVATAFAEDAARPPVHIEAPRVAPAPESRPAAQPASEQSEIERARAAAKASETGGDDLDRARAAARAADPRLQGLEKARDAIRGSDPAGGRDCMSAADARKAIGAKRAVALAQAVRSAKDASDGEVIDYRLCIYDGALAYELILLGADGKVVRARIDAANGKLLGVR